MNHLPQHEQEKVEAWASEYWNLSAEEVAKYTDEAIQTAIKKGIPKEDWFREVRTLISLEMHAAGKRTSGELTAVGSEAQCP